MYLLAIETNVNAILMDLGMLADTAPLARRVFPTVCAVLASAVASVFDQQGIPAWQPLADVTVYQRMSLGFSAVPILYRTGSLYRSMVGEGDLHVRELHLAFGVSTIKFGSADPRAVPLGRGLPEDNLPARPMFPPDTVLHPELQGSIVRHAQGVVS